jgi:hypothetical protein
MIDEKQKENEQDVLRAAEWFREHGCRVTTASRDEGICIVVEQRWLLVAECERIVDLLKEHGVEPQKIGTTKDGVEIHGLYDPLDDEDCAATIVIKRLDDGRLFGRDAPPS